MTTPSQARQGGYGLFPSSHAPKRVGKFTYGVLSRRCND